MILYLVVSMRKIVLQQYYNLQKMSKIFIILALFLFVNQLSASVIQCLQNSCKGKLENIQEIPSLSEVSNIVDMDIRRQFWYFIRRSDTIYISILNTGEAYIFFVVYQNRVGTFMAIADYSLVAKTTNVLTLIKLGDGVKSKIDYKYEVNPYFLEVMVDNQKYVLEFKNNGVLSSIDNEYQVKGSSKVQYLEQIREADKDLKLVDQHIRKTYWFFVGDAQRVKHQIVGLDSFKYVLITYKHKSGQYLAISSINLSTQQIKINTFVKLGQPSPLYNQESPSAMRLQSFDIVPFYFG